MGKRKVEKGYKNSEPVKGFIKSCKTTEWWKAVACALADLAAILGLATLGAVLSRDAPTPIWLAAHVLILPVIARCQRGLECLVHEGSHYNWSREHRLNDLLTDLLAAQPVFSRVASFRSGHTPHHFQFGSDNDTDLRRYRLLGIGQIDRGSLASYWRGTRSRFGAYILSWWRAIGLNAQALLGGLAWHLVLVILPLSLGFGVARAVALWALYWGLPLMIVLPALRFVAESGKHDYDHGFTEFDATISNIGPVHQLYFHPHGDGFHVLHHMEPCIPFYNLRRAHRGLMEIDPEGYGARHRSRTRVLEEPKTQDVPSLMS